MTSAYNFIAAWQLFPEKGTYQQGQRPRSGLLQITAAETKNIIIINNSWVSLEDKPFGFNYSVNIDGELQDYNESDFATQVCVSKLTSIELEISFKKNGEEVLNILHEIQPNGFLKITQQGFNEKNEKFIDVEFFHKQMSVLPYSASVSGAVIKPTQEGVIRHKVLTAMEEQTNMQLDQIKKQVELLAMQAQAIQARKELSMIVYSAKLNFQPNIGQTYHVYQNNDNSYMISMISPKEWGRSSKSYKSHYAKVQLLADHTWVEIL